MLDYKYISYIMAHIISYIKILRPANAVLAVTGVSIGVWLSGANARAADLVLLIITAACALGFGNVINDIKDAEADRTNHPARPIPKGEISKAGASVFAAMLAIISLITSYAVSPYHLAGTAIPLVLLTIYTLFLKGTPLLGNILVSALVAYTLIFGGIGSAGLNSIVMPALLAFLINLCREIVKDIQDKKGDDTAGLRTTASLSPNQLTIALLVPATLYVFLMFLPYTLGHFHGIYLVLCAAAVLPLHILWLYWFFKKDSSKTAGRISAVMKVEMLCGLAALALDKYFF